MLLIRLWNVFDFLNWEIFYFIMVNSILSSSLFPNLNPLWSDRRSMSWTRRNNWLHSNSASSTTSSSSFNFVRMAYLYHVAQSLIVLPAYIQSNISTPSTLQLFWQSGWTVAYCIFWLYIDLSLRSPVCSFVRMTFVDKKNNVVQKIIDVVTAQMNSIHD